VVASVGHYSGPAASTLKPVLEGAQLWVNAVNGRGGVNSHPVRLLVYDDAGDPARHRAQVQEAVERKGVMAFLAQQAPLTEAATVEYITNKRIPVIGSEGGTPGFYESPMYFPQHSSREALFSTWVDTVAARARTLGKNKVGLLYCVEANDCATYDKVFRNEAKQAGLELVYEAKATITQPDYTAECLSARNAGAQLVTMILDSNSVGRVASSCHRQGYDPQYVIGAAVALDRFKDDPLLADLTAATSVFPYFETGTPATDEFQAAVRSLGRGLTYGVGLATGWTAGKLLEKATKALPEPPTSAAVLAGLWSIHNDTLGGLTGPLSFTENQPAKPFVCGWHIQISKGAWVTPDGFAIHCR
jgi:branched-chain amino acid transport system substrate-binding protein